MNIFHRNLGGEFQIDAGIRIHGGNARDHPKKPFRLYFRESYGKKRLRFELFENSPVNSFDQLILRSGGHDSWSLANGFGRNEVLDIPPHGTLMRDQFLRKTEIEMGMLSPEENTFTFTLMVNIGGFMIYMNDLMPLFLNHT